MITGAYVLGFDVGGTRLKSGVVRFDGTLEHPTIDDTSQGGFQDTVLPLLQSRARDYFDAAGPGCLGIGIALPGLVETAFGSRFLPGKVTGIEDFPLRDALEREVGLPVLCLNDGAAATLAEWQFGAALGVDDVVGLTLGTGVGSGVIVAGHPFETSNFASGVSVGHFTIDHGGRLCLCGNRGCAETLISANAVSGRLRDALGRNVSSILAARFHDDPRSIGFPALAEGVRAGDRLCREILADFVRDLGATIVTAIHAYNPTVVVLAGGLLSSADLFIDDVQAYVDGHAFIFPKSRVVEIRVAHHEDHAGVLGAAALVMSTLAGAPS